MEQKHNNLSQKEFFTKDLNEAGAILASGIKLLRLDREANFYWFVFEDKSTQEVCNKFWSGELMLNAKQFSDALRSLKDRLFAQR